MPVQTQDVMPQHDAEHIVPCAVVQESASLEKGIRLIAAEHQLHILVVVIAGVALLAFSLYVTGCCHLIASTLLHQQIPLGAWARLAFPLLFTAVMSIIIRKLFVQRAQILSSVSVLQTATPISAELGVIPQDNDESLGTSWLVRIRQEGQPICTIRLLVPMDELRASTISGSIGHVYATIPQAPVVISTIDGILIGMR